MPGGMDFEIYRLRIDQVREASARSRRVYATATVAAFAIIGLAFNAYFSWLRLFPLLLDQFPKAGTVVEHLQRRLMVEWVESTFMTVPILGIRFSISDASVVGGLALAILSVWMFFGLRREHYLIATLLRDVRNETIQVRSLVFHGLIGSQLFATLTKNDRPFTSIVSQSQDQFRPLPGIRGVSKVLIFLPVVAIIFVCICDLLSLYAFGACFRENHAPLIHTFRAHNSLMVAAFVRVGIGFGLGIGTFILLRRANAFQSGTIQILKEVSNLGWGEGPSTTASEPPGPIASQAQVT